MTNLIKAVIFTSAGSFSGALIGKRLGAAAGFYVGASAGFFAGKFAVAGGDKSVQGGIPWALGTMGGVVGTVAGSALGLLGGGYIGGRAGATLADTTASGIYNMINSYAFEPIIKAASSIAGNINITEATHIAYKNAGVLAKSGVAALSENQLLIGAAVTASVVGVSGYKIYEHLMQKQQAEQENIRVKNIQLSKEKEHLNEQFQNLSLIISDATTKTQNSELKALHKQFVEQYFKKDNQIAETIHNLTLKYNEVMAQLPETKLKEVIVLGSDVLKSVAKCNELERDIGKHTGDVIKSRQSQETIKELSV